VVFTSRLWSVPFDASAGRTQGEGEPLTAADGRPHSFALSPDGNQVVYPLFHPGTPNEELWLTDLATHTSRRLASDAQHRFSLQWSKDGRRLAYLWTHQLENGKVDEALALWNLDTGEEQRIGSGTGESQKSSLFPTDWSPDGQAILTSSSIPKPPNMSLGLWSVAAAGHAERNPTTLAWDPDFDLGEGEARFSPNGKWIVFNAVNLRVPHSITIEVIPSTGATRSHWTTVTPPNEWADKPRWSPDGKVIYFTRYRNSYWNVWGVRFDDSTGRPIGEPFQVTHFDSVRHQIDPHVEGVELGVAARRLVLNLSEETRSIWMVDTLNR
jgi:Tol biopolymer transport system component